MEDMEYVDWQTKASMTNKLHPLHRLLISAQRSGPDMAAVRVNHQPKPELAGYKSGEEDMGEDIVIIMAGQKQG